jgi:DNA-binding XRE family transcriptional regulator
MSYKKLGLGVRHIGLFSLIEDYFYPQIVLTKVDKVEENIKEALKKTTADDYQREEKLREMIDLKIEEVVRKLGVPRETVHFIENYHEKRIILRV